LTDLIRKSLPLLILIALAGMTVWLERTTRVDDKPGSGKLRHDPDVIIDNFTLQRYDENGNVQHTLTAKQMRHYPDNDSAELDEPKLLYRGKLTPTHISAERATLGRDGKEAILRDNVKVLARSDRRPGRNDPVDQPAATSIRKTRSRAPISRCA
jgi:lipopolysaccharide export system protein LptC